MGQRDPGSKPSPTPDRELRWLALLALRLRRPPGPTAGSAPRIDRTSMNPLFDRILSMMERWMDRVVVPDERYACGTCDDRFGSRSLGVDHVLRCHPEYTDVVVFDGRESQIGLAA